MAQNDEAFQVVYDEAKRAIEDQQRVIGGLHARTGIVASASALVLSLVAQRAVAERPSSYLLLAFLAYVGVGFLSAFIFVAPAKMASSLPAQSAVVARRRGSPAPSCIAYQERFGAVPREVLGGEWRKIDQLSWALAVALICLLIEALLLIYDVWRG